MEKIYKLLKSSDEGDFKIGITLLLKLPEQEIVDFFILNHRRIVQNDSYDIFIPKDRIDRDCYIPISDDWVIIFKGNHIRLRKTSSRGYCRYFSHIKTDKFLNDL